MAAPDPDDGARPGTDDGARSGLSQARLDRLEQGVRGLIRDLASARADAADAEAARRRRDERLFLALIGVLDALDRVAAEAAAREGADATGGVAGNVRTVSRLLESTIRAEGVTALDTAHGDFDPRRHTVAETVAGAGEPGAIIREAWRGYALGDRVLRKPGVVVVGAEPGRAAPP